MRLKFFAFLMILGFSITSFGQNLVVNGSFEEMTKKPKNSGEIFLAEPWTSGTQAVPDLYSKSAKNDQIKIPVNAYGDEEPKEGDNYAGILIYSDREKEPRSYLTAKLKHKMLAGEHYCVKYHISFADLSKYATNNIGCYLSKDSVGSETDLILKHEPQVMHSTNRIFEKQWLWEDICRIYIADGGEEFITIGNFAQQNDVLKKAVKRPPGYTTTQFRDGYYYIDDISVLPNATPENCKCEPGKFAFANLNKEEAEFETNTDDIPDKVFISTTGEVHGEITKNTVVHDDVQIGFALGKSTIVTKETEKLKEVVSFLKANPDVKITLIGHQDNSEKVITGLSQKRIDQVGKYLMSNGVNEANISTDDAKTSSPLDTSGLKENRHMNMVVEISFSE